MTCRVATDGAAVEAMLVTDPHSIGLARVEDATGAHRRRRGVVERYRLDKVIARSRGYVRWLVSYLPGSPRDLPLCDGADRRGTSDLEVGGGAAGCLAADATAMPKQRAQRERGQNYWHLRGG